MKKLVLSLFLASIVAAHAATNSGAITFGTGLTLQPASGSATYTLTLPGTAGSANQFLQTDGSGTTTWTSVGSGTVTSIGLSTDRSWLTVGSSPVTSSGTITLNGTTGLTANQFLATPNGSTGAVSLRAIVGADLPNPSASTLGGVESLAAVTSKWINTISTSGVPSATQPAFSDISGTASATQIPVGSVNAQTISYTLVGSDSGKLVTFNGSSLTATLPSSPPNANWNCYIENLASSSLTIARNGLTINGGTSNITLPQYGMVRIFTDNTNYLTQTPLVAGTNITLTPAANGLTVAASGGGGTPGGSNTQVQYNNSSAFGGITNATSDGTTLTLTSPKIVTAINDTNGNSLVSLTATSSAVYGLTLANAASGGTVALGVTTPTQVAGATAGVPVSLTAANAVAGSSTTGAAVGGDVTITSGNAARLTSGNANGGNINLVGGTGIGTGTTGQVIVPVGTLAVPGLGFSGATNNGFYYNSNAVSTLTNGAPSITVFNQGEIRLNSGVGKIGWNASGDSTSSPDVALHRNGVGILEVNSGAAGTFRDLKVRQHYVDATLTASGTTGNQTINKAAGSVRIAAAGTSVTVTDNLCGANSLVFANVRTNDATSYIKNVVPSAGSFVITLGAAATAETEVQWLVINQ